MSFEIKYQTKAGIFNIKLERDVSADEAMQLAQIGSNVLGMGFNLVKAAEVHPPMSISGISGSGVASSSSTIATFQTKKPNNTIISSGRQEKLGERPADSINLGGYQEPISGVRLKMVSPPTYQYRVDAVKFIRSLTQLSMKAGYDVIMGNHKCPILRPEIAAQIMKSFKEWGIYAVLEGAQRDEGVSVGGLTRGDPMTMM